MKLNDFIRFEWDEANTSKNLISHQVSVSEIEQVFFNEPLLLLEAIRTVENEIRHAVLGKTENDRKLFIVFTNRKNKIRVISARDMSKKERKYYESSS